MKKNAKPVLLGVLIAVGVLLFNALILFGALISCRSAFEPSKTYSDGYFKYIIVTENGVKPAWYEKKFVAIVDFAGANLKQEVIDVPREIDGMPVRFIGGCESRGLMASTYYSLSISNLKKLYIHENIEDVYYDALDDMKAEFDIMLCAAKDPDLIFSYGSIYGARTYVYKSVYESCKKGIAANVVFMSNYLTEINDGYYSLDNIREGETIMQPSNPERSGYEFIGWYTEAECKNLWNFEQSPEIKEGEEFRLYAGWRAL